MTVSSSSTPGPALRTSIHHWRSMRLTTSYPSPSPTSDTGIVGETGHCTTSPTPSSLERSPAFWEETAQESRHCWTSPPECVVPHEEQCPYPGWMPLTTRWHAHRSAYWEPAGVCWNGLHSRTPCRYGRPLGHAGTSRRLSSTWTCSRFLRRHNRRACLRGSAQHSTRSSPWHATAQSCSWMRSSWVWMLW